MSDSPPPSFPRMVINAAITLGVMLIGTALLYQLAEGPWGPRDNVTYLLDHKDEFSIVLVGSSFVENMLDPREFDGEMAQRGYRTHTFNAGRGGTSAHEANHIVRKYLALTPARLAFVFVDFQPFGTSLLFSGTSRFSHWHDPIETVSVLRTVRMSVGPEEEARRKAVRTHLLAFLRKYSPIGKCFDLLAERRYNASLSAARGGSREDYYRAYRGYSPLSIVARGEDGGTERNRAEFLNRRDEYESAIEEILGRLGASEPYPLEGVNVDAWKAQVAFLREKKVEPVYLAPPALWGHPDLPRALLRNGVIDRAIFIDDPREYPQFFERDARFDKHHIAEAMVPEYSRIVANRFADMLDADPQLAGKLERSVALK